MWLEQGSFIIELNNEKNSHGNLGETVLNRQKCKCITYNVGTRLACLRNSKRSGGWIREQGGRWPKMETEK